MNMENKLVPSLGSGGSQNPIPKIMIIDDDVAHLQFIKLILLREGFTCELVMCEGPLRALEFLAQGPVDLILLDVMMPQIDGFGVLERVKQNPETAHIPVIILTSTLDTDYVVRAFAQGAVDYIAKPINSAVLTARLGAVLQRKELENELRLRNRQLERLNDFKDDMLSVCSHDLRAPLAAIEVLCGSLEQGRKQGEVQEGPGTVRKIVNQSRLARRLVENLLNYGKIQDGMLLPVSSFFPVQHFLIACSEDEQPFLQARDLQFELDLPERELVAFGDRELLAQAIRNILGNAIKFAKSTISLKVEMGKMTPEKGGELRLSITDDGPGIAGDEIRRVFAKYSKSDPGAPGAGLGLYIAHAAVKVHGGTITVTSQPDLATTFTIILPNVYAPSQLPDLHQIAEGNVLVLSPDRHTAEQMEGVLLEAGMVNVSTEISSRPELEQLEQLKPEVVLVDLATTLNVIHLAKIINGCDPGIRWIFHGSQSDADTLCRLVTPTCSRLEAPLSPLALLNMISQLLGGNSDYAKGATISA